MLRRTFKAKAEARLDAFEFARHAFPIISGCLQEIERNELIADEEETAIPSKLQEFEKYRVND